MANQWSLPEPVGNVAVLKKIVHVIHITLSLQNLVA
jgi:hypothetical protein